MTAVEDVFAQLRSQSKRAFMPFITAGDPDLEFTAECLKTLDAAGSSLIELGIPYSDPIADGPTIQASYTRALNAGVHLDGIFEMASKVVPKLSAPVVTMVSYAIIFRMGTDEYLRRAKAAGFAGAIVPDLPADESDEFASECAANDFSLIQLVTPTTPLERAAVIAKKSTGFLYYVSIAGITGARTELPSDLVENLRALRQKTDLPICVGFGISQPSHAEMLKPVADGIIVGSAIVRKMETIHDDETRSKSLAEISDFVRSMVEAVE